MDVAWRCRFAALALVAAAGCAEEHVGGPGGEDAAAQDGAVPDGPPTFDAIVFSDADRPDAAADAEPDAEPDTGLDTGLAPDLTPPDAAAPDHALPSDFGPVDAACRPAPERCDGLDNDCDGTVDEGFNVGAACGVGVGACRTPATVACDAAGESHCPAEAGAPAAERCNGLDDDCDGRLDETFDFDGDQHPRCDFDPCQGCPFDDAARCEALCARQDCRDENFGVNPGAEDICGDGIDQNCDGMDAPCVQAEGRVVALSIAPAGFAGCVDGNGDGAPDNALAVIGGLANGALADAVADGDLNLVLVAEGLLPPGAEGNFALGVVTAQRAQAGPEPRYAVDAAAVDAQGRARIRFPRARVRGGALASGTGRFALNLPLAGIDLALVLEQTRIAGAFGVAAAPHGGDAEALGVSLDGGVLWGAVPDTELQAALDGLEATCAAAGANPPEYCGPLRMFRPLLGNLLRVDQDLDGDGVPESYSTCLQLDARPAAVIWP